MRNEVSEKTPVTAIQGAVGEAVGVTPAITTINTAPTPVWPSSADMYTITTTNDTNEEMSSVPMDEETWELEVGPGDPMDIDGPEFYCDELDE